MNRNKILITILAIIGLIFVGLILKLTNQNQLSNLNQTINTVPLATQIPADGVFALLQPETITATPNQPFTIKLNYTNLKSPLQGADLIVNFNPEILEFVRIENSNPNFLNARTLTDLENKQLIISFIEKADQQEPFESELEMTNLVFIAKKTGQTTLSPILNQENNSSVAIIKGSSTNKLVSVNPVTITIQ